jgi:hypothetical protein
MMTIFANVAALKLGKSYYKYAVETKNPHALKKGIETIVKATDRDARLMNDWIRSTDGLDYG